MLFSTIIVFLPIASPAVVRDGNAILRIAAVRWTVSQGAPPGRASGRLLAEVAAGSCAPA